ncbi:MAG: hypothetical protein HY858_03485 [Candidatus Solibacter usitatus]|nr:hypothetical protein [Candidatus Solibacter usitatus]
MKTLMVLLTISLAACGQTGNPRAKALADAVARGDKALAAGQPRQASAAWSLLLLFEPNHAEVKKKLDALPPGSEGGNFSRTQAEIGFMMAAIREMDTGKDLCGFPEATPDMDLATIRMISDARLLPNLESSPFSVQSGGCAGSGAFIFLAKPLLSMAEVRQAYGKPQAERKDADGSEVLTYGRVRILGAKDGQATLVLLRPSNR